MNNESKLNQMADSVNIFTDYLIRHRKQLFFYKYYVDQKGWCVFLKKPPAAAGFSYFLPLLYKATTVTHSFNFNG